MMSMSTCIQQNTRCVSIKLLGGRAPATLYRLRAELNTTLGNTKEAAEDLRRAEELENPKNTTKR